MDDEWRQPTLAEGREGPGIFCVKIEIHPGARGPENRSGLNNLLFIDVRRKRPQGGGGF